MDRVGQPHGSESHACHSVPTVNHGVSVGGGTGTLWTTVSSSTDAASRLRPTSRPWIVLGMGLPGDPAVLERLARQIRDHADDLRGYAARLVAAAEVVRWQSPAAARFRAHVHSLASELRAGARRVDDAADELHAHASAVRRVRHALDAADAAVHAAQRAGSAFVHAIGM